MSGVLIFYVFIGVFNYYCAKQQSDVCSGVKVKSRNISLKCLCEAAPWSLFHHNAHYFIFNTCDPPAASAAVTHQRNEEKEARGAEAGQSHDRRQGVLVCVHIFWFTVKFCLMPANSNNSHVHRTLLVMFLNLSCEFQKASGTFKFQIRINFPRLWESKLTFNVFSKRINVSGVFTVWSFIVTWTGVFSVLFHHDDSQKSAPSLCWTV